MCFFLDPSPVRRVPIQTGIQRKLNFVSVRTIKGPSSRAHTLPTHTCRHTHSHTRDHTPHTLAQAHTPAQAPTHTRTRAPPTHTPAPTLTPNKNRHHHHRRSREPPHRHSHTRVRAPARHACAQAHPHVWRPPVSSHPRRSCARTRAPAPSRPSHPAHLLPALCVRTPAVQVSLIVWYKCDFLVLNPRNFGTDCRH